jgi:hypothetical protein
MRKLTALVCLCACAIALRAQEIDVAKRLEGLDGYMAKVLADWNGPGIGVGIVVGDKLVFANYTIAEMVKAPEHGVGFTEKRDTFDLYQTPYYEDIEGVAPCGAVVSNIDDLSHWLIALMNDGMYHGRQVLPKDVLQQTLQPAIGMPNTGAEQRGYWELLNAAYGMGRWTASYRGHLIAITAATCRGSIRRCRSCPRRSWA